MDGKQFDRLTKSLSSGASRRRMLGGLGAMTAGLLVARSAAAKARPINKGCDQAGRTCTEGSCCGNQLTCTEAMGLSSSCRNLSGNNKCCFQVGSACHGHCECCGAATACIDGRCTSVVA